MKAGGGDVTAACALRAARCTRYANEGCRPGGDGESNFMHPPVASLQCSIRLEDL